MSDVTRIRDAKTDPMLMSQNAVLDVACELRRDWGRPEAERLRMIMREYFKKLKHRID